MDVQTVPTPAEVGTAAPRTRAARVRASGAARSVPQRSPGYAHLDLPALRAYRAALSAEESNVSYWRRILQARLDVVQAGTGRELDPGALRPLLTRERVGAGRQALVQVLPTEDIPPLPELGELWERRVDPSDQEGSERLAHDLRAAEAQLSAYRAALHERIGTATDELIARYREDPTLCLSALPLDRP